MNILDSYASRPCSGEKLIIALVIKNFVTTGGAEKYAVETARRILDMGHSIDLYAREIDPKLTQGMTVFKVPDKLKFSSVLSLYSFARESARMLAGKSYDVIHSHDKGCEAHISTVHTFSFKKGMEEMSLLKKLNEFGISPRVWLYLYMEAMQVRSSRLVGVSEIIKADMGKSHKRIHGISVIPPGVDIEKFSPGVIQIRRSQARSEANLRPDDIAVLFVGSEFKRKGLDFLIPALAKAKSKMKLFVVGRQERMGHYQSLVEDHNLSDQVIFTGLTDEVLTYYALADILVLPSISEAFGMTVLEGMACGLPVITSHNAGCSSLIESGKNGFVFKKSKELTDFLNILSDQKIRAALGSRARETAEKHTWDDTALSYEKLYYDIANGKQKNIRALG